MQIKSMLLIFFSFFFWGGGGSILRCLERKKYLHGIPVYLKDTSSTGRHIFVFIRSRFHLDFAIRQLYLSSTSFPLLLIKIPFSEHCLLLIMRFVSHLNGMPEYLGI